MPVYVHHSKKGPDLAWDLGKIAGLLAEVRYSQGRFQGRMECLGPSLREEAEEQVYLHDTQSFADGRFAAMIHEAARQYDIPLTKNRLLRWHSELYPLAEKSTARSKVHFQASAGEGSEGKLNNLIHWVNSATDTDPVVKAAVAQLWLVIIRPFEVGNERLGELVMEGLLARANQSGERFYSVAGQMRSNSTGATNFHNPADPPDITSWIEWFLGSMGLTIKNSNETMGLILQKEQFRERFTTMPLNDRQRVILKLVLDEPESKLTSSKWAALTNTSQDTAGRDINDLVQRGILTRGAGGGRSTSYAIATMH